MRTFFFYAQSPDFHKQGLCYYLIALFLNKLYLSYDVSPLNKVFTALHRSTSVCILGTHF